MTVWRNSDLSSGTANENGLGKGRGGKAVCEGSRAKKRLSWKRGFRSGEREWRVRLFYENQKALKSFNQGREIT